MPENGMVKDAIDLAGERSLRYVTSRQCRNGGFCFYRTEYLEEPNLHDTYYALVAYRLMDRPVPNRDRVVDYLRSATSYGAQTSYLYYLARGMRLLGCPDQYPELQHRIAQLHIRPLESDDSLSISSWLEDALMVARLRKTFAEATGFEPVKHVIGDLRAGHYRAYRRNLLDTYLMLRILAELDRLQEIDDLKRFVDAMQAPSLGFRMTQTSAAINMDILYAGVFSCAMSGIAITYAHDIVGHVLASQKKDGGFARAPAAAGDLQTNYKGLRVLHYLTADLAG